MLSTRRREIYHTVGTTLVQCMQQVLALDSQQYILRDCRLLVGNGCRSSEQLQGQSFQVLKFPEP